MALRQIASSIKGKGRAVYPWISEAALPVRRISTTASKSNNISTGAITASSSSAAAIPPQSSIDSSNSAISLLRSQPLHYVVASIAGRTLVLHPHDLVTLPRLNDVEIGDIIELDRIHEVGSRDYTLRAQDPMGTRSKGPDALSQTSTNTRHSHLLEMLKGAAIDGDPEVLTSVLDEQGNVKESQSWAAKLKPGGLAHVGSILSPNTVRVRCTIVEHTKGQMEFIVKKKRRKGYKKTIKHKQTYTRLRVEGIQLGPQIG